MIDLIVDTDEEEEIPAEYKVKWEKSDKMWNAVADTNNDPFTKLPDEVLLEIFKWLPEKIVARSSRVCYRFYRISQDIRLWRKLNLGGETVHANTLKAIMGKGVRILRLAQTEILQPTWHDDLHEDESVFRVQYLDLSLAQIETQTLYAILEKCRNLIKLSLESLEIRSVISFAISKMTSLTTLNLALARGITPFTLYEILTNLQNLESLNISWTVLSMRHADMLVNHITPNLRSLSIGGFRKFRDWHLQTLSRRCRLIAHLDMNDCTGLGVDAVEHISNLQMLTCLGLSRRHGIPSFLLTELESLPNLAYLDVFGMLPGLAVAMLKDILPYVSINEHICCSIARPSYGDSRTSIWGLNTEDR